MNATLEKGSEVKRSERRIIHIVNPMSGSGRKFRRTRDTVTSLGEELYLTKREGDCEDFVAEMLVKDPYCHIVAHGGDGTMSEAAGGIVKAGAGETALFSGVPAGSGNDLLRYLLKEKNVFGRIYPTDLIGVGGRYAINEINMGFDCTAASEAERIRKVPGIGGSFSYIAGVATAFVKKEGFFSKVTLEGVPDQNGEHHDETVEDELLLVALANGQYYGGGFRAAPTADTGDGYLDAIIVKNVPRNVFVSLVADYKNGSHIDRETGKVAAKFRNFVRYRRCKNFSLTGIREFSRDGEITPANELRAEILPKAILYTPPKSAWLE